MTSAKSGFGTTLERAGNAIAELTNIGGVEVTMETKDVTNHQSEDSYREFIGTLFEAGEVPISGNFIGSDTNGQVALLADLHNKTAQSFVMTFPDGTTWTFTALVTKFKVEPPMEEAIAFSATLKVSGKPTLAVSIAGDLTLLVVTTGVLVPALTASLYEYVAIIATEETTVTITPTQANASSITVDGEVVASGDASSAIALGAAGSITDVNIVVSEASKADRTYTIHLVREGA